MLTHKTLSRHTLLRIKFHRTQYHCSPARDASPGQLCLHLLYSHFLEVDKAALVCVEEEALSITAHWVAADAGLSVLGGGWGGLGG